MGPSEAPLANGGGVPLLLSQRRAEGHPQMPVEGAGHSKAGRAEHQVTLPQLGEVSLGKRLDHRSVFRIASGALQ